ncbi:MAG TPA: hypothetical protein DCR55_03935 [Lentisphaeria bacterium]|nr:hypothetical protein [Lentisphaeria bacterium]
MPAIPVPDSRRVRFNRLNSVRNRYNIGFGDLNPTGFSPALFTLIYYERLMHSLSAIDVACLLQHL